MENILSIKEYHPYCLCVKDNFSIQGYFIYQFETAKIIPKIFKSIIADKIVYFELFKNDDYYEYLGEKVELFEISFEDQNDKIINKTMKVDMINNNSRNVPIRGSGFSMYDHLDKTIKKVLKENKYDQYYLDLILNNGSWNYFKICTWFKTAGDLVKEYPKLNYFKNEWNIFRFASEKDKFQFIQLHKTVPKIWKKYFKSTKEGYEQAVNFFKEGKKNKFGYTILAKDGHICNSLSEMKIDNFLFENKMKHDKEPNYPGIVNWRGDFKYKDIIIEFFGLKGQENYDKKTEEKINYAKMLGFPLIAIYPEDMDNLNYKKKLLALK